MKKILILLLVLALFSSNSYGQQTNVKDKSNVKLIKEFIADISATDHNFSIRMLSNYFDESEELESDLSVYYLESRFGISKKNIDEILINNFSKGLDTIPSIAILFLRCRNLHCLTQYNQDNIQIIKIKEGSIVKEGLEYKQLIYKVFNIKYKEDYLLFEMNPYIDERSLINNIRDNKGKSVFNQY